jgi:hypothetical protein
MALTGQLEVLAALDSKKEISVSLNTMVDGHQSESGR